MTGVRNYRLVLPSGLVKYVRREWLAKIVGESLKEISVTRLALFASGKSVMLKYEIKTEEGKNILMGKWFRRPIAIRQAAVLRALASCDIPGPRVVWNSQDRHFLLYRALEGHSLADNIADVNVSKVVSSALEWLGQYQRCRVLRRLLKPFPVTRSGHEIKKIAAKLEKIYPSEAHWIQVSARTLEDALTDWGKGETPIHGDFNPRNIIVGGTSNFMGVVDFSDVSLGVPEFDVGSFLAALDFLYSDGKSSLATRHKFFSNVLVLAKKQKLNFGHIEFSRKLAILRHLWVVSGYGEGVKEGIPIARGLIKIARQSL